MIYSVLAQEPWCFTPSMIAPLTDWQLEMLYLRPAERRAKEMRGEGNQHAEPSRLEQFFASGVPPLEEFVREMMASFPGQSAEHWSKVWEDAKRIEKERGRGNAGK